MSTTYYIHEQNIALYARQMLFMELLQNGTIHVDDSERAEAFLEVRFVYSVRNQYRIIDLMVNSF